MFDEKSFPDQIRGVEGGTRNTHKLPGDKDSAAGALLVLSDPAQMTILTAVF